MTFRGRILSRLLTVLIAVAGLISVSALPAVAGHSRTVQYVALGDSYAAGQGAGDYFDEDCLRSADGYPALLDSLRRLHLRANASCSGDKTTDVLDQQVSALNTGTGLVTLTVGANDLGVAAVARVCIANPTSPDCQRAIGDAVGRLPQLAASLSEVYTAIATAAPRAKILVTGYPYLFNPSTPCTPTSVEIVCQINAATTLLNQTIASTVATMPDSIDIQYVDVTVAFEGHGIGGDLELYINDSGTDAYHPNVAGYEAYAEALIAALRRTGLGRAS